MTTTKMTLKSIIANGGATLNAQGLAVDYKTGFQVSRRDVLVVPVRKLRWAMLRALYERGAFVGVWVYEGKAYVDISEHIQGKAHAVAVGGERGQISIWDWAKKTCVFCAKTLDNDWGL